MSNQYAQPTVYDPEEEQWQKLSAKDSDSTVYSVIAFTYTKFQIFIFTRT